MFYCGLVCSHEAEFNVITVSEYLDLFKGGGDCSPLLVVVAPYDLLLDGPDLGCVVPWEGAMGTS